MNKHLNMSGNHKWQPIECDFLLLYLYCIPFFRSVNCFSFRLEQKIPSYRTANSTQSSRITSHASLPSAKSSSMRNNSSHSSCPKLSSIPDKNEELCGVVAGSVLTEATACGSGTGISSGTGSGVGTDSGSVGGFPYFFFGDTSSFIVPAS